MADLATIVISVNTTLSVQALYFLLIKFPAKFAEEALAVSAAQRSWKSKSEDSSEILKTTQASKETIDRASEALSSGANLTPQLRLDLLMSEARLSGLSACDEPLNSHVQHVRDGIVEALEIVGDDQIGSVDAKQKFLMIYLRNQSSFRLVERKLNNDIEILSEQVEQRSESLRTLIDTLRMSVFSLQFAITCFAFLGCRVLYLRGGNQRWVAVLVAAAALGLMKLLDVVVHRYTRPAEEMTKILKDHASDLGKGILSREETNA